MRQTIKKALLAAAAVLGLGTAAEAQKVENVTVAIGQGGKWDATLPQLGSEKGIFEKHGLKLDILYTEGGGETQQIIISGSADIGVAVGTQGVMGAFAKGAPIRIIGSAANGDDAFYYAKADSPLNSLKDMKGQTIAYSRNGSSTHTFVLGFINLLGINAKPVATGGPPATLTAVMSGQVDVGWSAPPFGLEQLNKGEIKIVGSSLDLPSVKDHTVRLIVTNLQTLRQRPHVVQKFMDAYRETIEWAYSGDEALQAYAKLAKVDVAVARRIRDEFDTREYINPDVILGVDDLMKEAIEFKYLDKPLTDAQLNELILVKGWKK
jgi:NitT/TauT family transport system substrate-binding protein